MQGDLAYNNGRTKLLTDRDGNPVQAVAQYYAYGREQAPGSLAGLPTDYAFTGQRQDNTGLIYMNARYYDPELGQFLSPDTLVPDPTNLFDYNWYMYARGNPIKYNDPSGHCPVICTAIIGGVVGGLVTTGTYLATTSYDDWNWRNGLTVAGAGIVGGALIGSGIGIAAGTEAMSAGLSMATSAAVASGAGGIVSSESYMFGSAVNGNKFDNSDFVVQTTAGAIDGAVNSTIVGKGIAPGLTRSGVSGVIGAAAYAAQQTANGQDITLSGAAHAGAVTAVSAGFADALGGGFSASSSLQLRNPQTIRDWVPTGWINRDLNGREIWRAANEYAFDAWRSVGRGTAVFTLMGYVDSEANK